MTTRRKTFNWPFVLGVFSFGLFIYACGRRPTFNFSIDGEDPNGLLLEAVKIAAERWHSATGLNLFVSSEPARIQIRWVTPDWLLQRTKRNDAQGLTSYERSGRKVISIRNDIGNFDEVVKTVVHEMAHAMSDGQMNHSATGIMADTTYDDIENTLINLDSLEALCKTIDCQVMNPENA